MQKKKIKYYYEKGKDYNSQKMEEQKRKKMEMIKIPFDIETPRMKK